MERLRLWITYMTVNTKPIKKQLGTSELNTYNKDKLNKKEWTKMLQ